MTELKQCILERMRGCAFQLKLLSRAEIAFNIEDMVTFFKLAKELRKNYDYFITEGETSSEIINAMDSLKREITYYMQAYHQGIEFPMPYELTVMMQV